MRVPWLAARRAQRLLLPAALALASAPASSQAQTTTCGSASSVGTLTVLNLTGADALNAASSCTDGGQVDAVWAGAVTLATPISVGSGTFLSITGEGDLAEVKGGLSTRLFDVSEGGELSLKQLKLSSGSAASGGAISSSSATLTLESCVFVNNNASDGDGGAVWAQGGELTIIGGDFSGNSASEMGGAVAAIDARTMVIQGNATFDGNHAAHGGAVYCGGAEPETGASSSCSLAEAVFLSNTASRGSLIGVDISKEYLWPWLNLEGGGAAAFGQADVDIANSSFHGNYGQLSGGGVFGGNDAIITVNGCSFSNNSTPGYGGAMAAASVTIGGNSVVEYNSADVNGGGVFAWGINGTVILNDLSCHDNIATKNGGCLHASGIAQVHEGAVLRDNVARLGACLYSYNGSNMLVDGGEFTCQSTKNGGFLFASDGSRVNITGGLIVNNTAARRGAAVYCSGDSFDMGGSAVTIEGGTFVNNEAFELGGGIVAWGPTTVVTVKGGIFRNNTGKFYGGFIFLEEEASLICDGATIQENSAGDQGGGIYAREAKWVNSSCDILGSESPQGAAAYLTDVTGGVTFENLDIIDNLASGGSVVFVSQSSVTARMVRFESGVGLLKDSSNRALQLDSSSSMICEECVFTGWLGDTVIHSTNAADGSLVLDSCDFSGSAAITAVVSLYSDAEIRNAVVGDATLENVAIVDGSVVLVNRAINCRQPNACGAGECLNSSLGVLCECLEDGACLDGGGALSLTVHTPPSTVTYSPDLVSFELSVSAADDGTTPAIWDLSFEADELELNVVPSSGVLPPGGNITVTVTGSPLVDDVGGNLTSRFVLTSVGSNSTDSTAGVEVQVGSIFYLCRAFEYAVPDDEAEVGISCEQCADIDDADGVNCTSPGATLASLPVRDGYWRSSNDSSVVLSCLHQDSCVGATDILSSDDYCTDGNRGPYCAICSEGYAKGVGSICYSCDGDTGNLLFSAGIVFAVVMLILVAFAFVFLVGGLDAVSIVHQSVSKVFYGSAKETKAIAPADPSLRATNGTIFTRLESPRLTFRSATPNSNRKVAIASSVTSAEKKHDDRSPIRPSDTIVGTPGPSATVSGGGEGKTAAAFEGESGVGVNGASNGSIVGAGEAGENSGSLDIPAPEGDPKPRCCGLSEKIKRWGSRLPFDKLKILVVVWQILTVFPAITGVDFPRSYTRFLSLIDVVNLDIGEILSASCILPSFNFYHRLLASTLGPIGVAGVLVGTYHLAKRRAGFGPAGVEFKRAAWSRHMAAALLLTFLVFTSTSTTVFKTFACDGSAVEGESFLRADYRLSCKTDTYMFFSVYAGLMLLVYPIGIPLLYAFILWRNRHLLNPLKPQPRGLVTPTSGGVEEATEEDELTNGPPARGLTHLGTPFRNPENGHVNSADELLEREERVRMRMENPELVPSMFLWKDFGPDFYYYEVIECGRRILLTGVLIFIAPESPTQVAMACIFAFFGLLGFELLRPHLDSTDVWLYRLGCIVIFLSNFLALLIRVEAAEEERQETLGGLLIGVNLVLVIAVLVTTWFSTQQMVEGAREGEDSVGVSVAKTMLTAERLAANDCGTKREGK